MLLQQWLSILLQDFSRKHEKEYFVLCLFLAQITIQYNYYMIILWNDL